MDGKINNQFKQTKRYMKQAKTNQLPTSRGIVKFINEAHIKQEDIITITQSDTCFTIFYYGE